MKNRLKRWISLMLVVCLIVSAMPFYAFAETPLNTENEAQSMEESNPLETDSVPEIAAEDPSLREEKVKHFLNSDGSYTAVSYLNPVHYKENEQGEWIEIDNTLIESTTFVDNQESTIYTPTASPLDVSLVETDSNSFVTLKNGQYEISWHYETSKKGKSEKKEIKEAENAEKKLAKKEEKLNVKTLSGRVYKDKEDDVDIEVILDSDKLKENLILQSKNVKNNYTIVYEIGDLTPIQEDDRTIGLFDSKEEKIFTITAPVMEDANKVASNDLTLKIQSLNDGELRTVLKIDKNWLNDKERAFPVKVDPYVLQETNTTEGDASSYYLAQSAYPIGTLSVGNDAGSVTGVARSFVKFTLPTLKMGDMVTGAYFGIAQYRGEYGYSHVGNSSLQINIHKVTSPWSESSIRASSAFRANPSIESSIADFTSVRQTSVYKYITFDVSRIVKEWYLGEANYGVCLKADDEDAWALANFIATDSMDVDARPYLQIIYLNNKGLEDRWTYHEQDMGESGTGYINDYTGNLVYIVPLLGTGGSRMPVDISLIYNGYQAGQIIPHTSPVGTGWRLNLHTRLTILTSSSTGLDKKLYDAGYRFIYTDMDGTDHYFYAKPGSSNTYIDEEGLDLTLTKPNRAETQEVYEIEDKSGNRIVFTESGGFVRCYDHEGNYYRMQYTGRVMRYVEDGSGKSVTFTTNQDGYITAITDPAGREYILTYEGTALSSITYPDGTSVEFDYINSKLAVVNGKDDVRLKYHYPASGDASRGGRVIKIEEYSNEDETSFDSSYLGNSLDISYGRNKTDFVDNKGNRTRYIFDNYGRTTNVITPDGMSGNYKYNNPVSGNSVYNSTSAHLLNGSTAISTYVNNLLYNHGFEGSSLVYWSTSSANLNTSISFVGHKSIEINQGGYAFQPANVSNLNDYTFSSYVKTEADGKGRLLVECLDGAGNVIYTKSSITTGRAMNWERIYVSFTVPSEAVTTNVKCVNDGTSKVYFDCTQLEEGLEVNPYSMLGNSGFDDVIAYTWGGTNVDAATARVLNSDSERSSYVMKIQGDGYTKKYLSQTIWINRPAKDIDIKVGMLGKAESVALSDMYRQYGMLIHSFFTDGTMQEDYIGFNADYISGWQRLSGVISYGGENQNKTVNYVVIRMTYSLNENTAYFDDITVQMDETGMSYTYDDEGNLISAYDNSERTTSYSYTSAGEILSATNEDNKQYEYAYDSSNPHRLISATSKSSNLKFNFGYGDFGNVTSQTVQAIDNSAQPYGEYIKTESIYTEDGNYLIGESDDRGKSYFYEYNQNKGILNSVIDKKGNVTYYDYNEDNDYLTSVSDKETETDVDATTVDYEYNSKLQLTDFNTNSTNYTFSYDSFSNPLQTKAGDNILNTNTYEANNGNLLSSTYGNGFIKAYMYDNFNRLVGVKYDGEEKFTYSYNSEGFLSRHEDKVNNKTYQYTYDLIGRPVRVESSDGSYIESGYDQMNLATRSNYRLGNESKNVAYTYSDRDNLPESVSFDGKTVTNIYDDLTRLTSKAYSLGNTSGSVSYTYLDHETDANRTTGVVGSISYFGENSDLSLGTRYYDYDNQGDVIREYRYSKDELGLRESYEYDSKNQLIRHNSKTQNKTFTYSYDNAGNILSKNEYAYTTSETLGTPAKTLIYLYESTDGWGDKLTSYDGKAITYDAIGNMISFDGKTYSWQGRELTQITSATDMYSYKYDAEGIRTEKTVNGVKTEYFLNGSQILAETTDGNTMWFIYDSQGSRVALVQNGQVFYYMYNLQGDVIGLIDETTGNVVATYDYDAWGRCTLIENAEGYTVGTDNPFRYRGYYYDEETGFYYVSSRYYDPEIGRFISADIMDVLGISPMALTDKNLYAYCDNNPVVRMDVSGEFWIAAIGVGVVTQYAGDVLLNIAEGATGISIFSFRSSPGEYIAAGLTTLIPGSGLGGALVRNIATEGIVSAERYLNGESNSLSGSIGKIALGTVVDTEMKKVASGVSSYINSKTPKNYSSYAGQQYKKNPDITQQQIRENMSRAKRWGNRLSSCFSFVIDVVKSAVRF